MELNCRDMAAILSEIAAVMKREKENLCGLDARMGDGDLGLTMSKGWAIAAEASCDYDDSSIGKLLVKAGMKMSSAVPSTMGTLMASGLMEAGKHLKDIDVMGEVELALFLQGICDGIQRRGKCAPGDRTVLDAIWPAAQVAKNLPESFSHAVRTASLEGLEATKQMVPKFGKAAVFAERAAGFQDQGALVGYMIVDCLCSYLDRQAI